MPHRFAVWRTSARCLVGYSYFSTFSAAQDARWPSPQADFANMAIVSDPTQTSGKAEFCDHARSRRMPEVITSRAPATECLHAHARVARMSWLKSHPRTPIAFRWCLYSIRRAAFRTAFSRVSSWWTPNVEIRCSSSTRTVGCVPAWGVARARHSRVSLRTVL